MRVRLFLFIMLFFSAFFRAEDLFAVQIPPSAIESVSSEEYSGCGEGQNIASIRNGNPCVDFEDDETCTSLDQKECRQSCCALNNPGHGHGDWDYEGKSGWIEFQFFNARRITSVSFGCSFSKKTKVYFGSSMVAMGRLADNSVNTATNPSPNVNIDRIKITRAASENWWNINNVRFFCEPKTCAADYAGNCRASLEDGCGGTIDCSSVCASGLYAKVMSVECPAPMGKVDIAGFETSATETSKMKVYEDGKTYSVSLVETTDTANRSCKRVRIDGKTWALRRCVTSGSVSNCS